MWCIQCVVSHEQCIVWWIEKLQQMQYVNVSLNPALISVTHCLRWFLSLYYTINLHFWHVRQVQIWHTCSSFYMLTYPYYLGSACLIFHSDKLPASQVWLLTGHLVVQICQLVTYVCRLWSSCISYNAFQWGKNRGWGHGMAMVRAAALDYLSLNPIPTSWKNYINLDTLLNSSIARPLYPQNRNRSDPTLIIRIR